MGSEFGRTTLSAASKRFINQLIKKSNLPLWKLEQISDIDKKTWKKICDVKNTRKINGDTLVDVARTLGVTEDEIIAGARLSRVDGEILPNFELLMSIFKEIDAWMLPVMRDHQHLEPAKLWEVYDDLLRSNLQKKGIDLDDLIRQFHDRTFLEKLVQSIPPPDLDIYTGENFSTLTFSIKNREPLRINRPNLLWDCHCETYGTKFEPRDCSIHSNEELSAEIESRWEVGLIRIHYGDCFFYWSNDGELWPPSVDTFFMYQNMVNDSILTRKMSNILDVGAGTGFLGIMTAIHNPHVKRLDILDWLLWPFLFSLVNWTVNKRELTHKKITARIGLFTFCHNPLETPYDTIICNPPYLPLLQGFKQYGMTSAVVGTDLMSHMIENCPSLGKETYLQISDLALPEARLAAKISKTNLKKIGLSKNVPFRIFRLRDKIEYVIKLNKERKLTIDYKNRHPYWHTIRTYKIESLK